MNAIRNFLRDEDAATAVEYAVMLAMIIMTAIAAISSFGASTNGLWGNIDTELDNVGF